MQRQGNAKTRYYLLKCRHRTRNQKNISKSYNIESNCLKTKEHDFTRHGCLASTTFHKLVNSTTNKINTQQTKDEVVNYDI